MYSFDVNEADFQKIVIEGSQQTLVLVDFWAPWCGPCKTLKPLLEKLAEEYQGKFILAKVDSDKNQALASQFGVRGIPNVKAIFQGKVVKEFSGALPEAELRTFIDGLLPSPADELVATAIVYRQNNQQEAAENALNKALTMEPKHLPAQIELTQLYLSNNKINEARRLLDQIPAADQFDELVKSLKSKVELAESTENLPGTDDLIAVIKKDETDLQARLDLAHLYTVQEDYEKATEQLFEILRRDRQFADDAARKSLLTIFDVLGHQNALVRASRKTLASLLN